MCIEKVAHKPCAAAFDTNARCRGSIWCETSIRVPFFAFNEAGGHAITNLSGVAIMNRRLNLLAIAFGLSAPLFASAQTSSTQGLTREQVRQDMAEYEASGYNPARQNPRTWVDDARAASARVMTARAGGTLPQLAVNKADGASHCD